MVESVDKYFSSLYNIRRRLGEMAMILDLNKIKDITCGAVKIKEVDGYIEFDRMNDTQKEKQGELRAYKQRARSTSGVRLAMITDSKKISFNYKFLPAAPYPAGFFDIYVDGSIISHQGSEDGDGGNVEVELGCGKKKVEVYFPWARRAIIANLTLDDGAVVEPLKRRLKLLAYGDSITHGTLAMYPSLTYICRLASMLNADIVSSKGIGGDVFSDRIISAPDDLDPDIITVAYGSNDWSREDPQDVAKAIRRFFSLLRAAYPEAKIFAITPIWRADFEKQTQFSFGTDGMDGFIRENAKGIYDIIFINGWNMVPHLPEFFSDGFLHPNDLGHGIYAQNLYKEISKYLR